MTYFCYFSFGENLDFPDFLQKKFYNINYRSSCKLTAQGAEQTLYHSAFQVPHQVY